MFICRDLEIVKAISYTDSTIEEWMVKFMELACMAKIIFLIKEKTL